MQAGTLVFSSIYLIWGGGLRSLALHGMPAAPSGSGRFGRLGIGLGVGMRVRNSSVVVGFLPNTPSNTKRQNGTALRAVKAMVMGLLRPRCEIAKPMYGRALEILRSRLRAKGTE